MQQIRFLPFAIALSLASGLAGADSDVLIPPDEPISGVQQAEWSVRWWQWAFSFERVRSPIADRTGELCASRQTGDVWFLAGTYGTGRTVRTCTVPQGKTLFFPLINYVAFRGGGSTESCMSLAARAAALTSSPSTLVLEIDGRRYESLQPHRLATPCFGLVPGQPADAVANGYYAAVRPLPKGRHELHFLAVLPDMIQAVSYQLNVE